MTVGKSGMRENEGRVGDLQPMRLSIAEVANWHPLGLYIYVFIYKVVSYSFKSDKEIFMGFLLSESRS